MGYAQQHQQQLYRQPKDGVHAMQMQAETLIKTLCMPMPMLPTIPLTSSFSNNLNLLEYTQQQLKQQHNLALFANLPHPNTFNCNSVGVQTNTFASPCSFFNPLNLLNAVNPINPGQSIAPVPSVAPSVFQSGHVAAHVPRGQAARK